MNIERVIANYISTKAYREKVEKELLQTMNSEISFRNELEKQLKESGWKCNIFSADYAGCHPERGYDDIEIIVYTRPEIEIPEYQGGKFFDRKDRDELLSPIYEWMKTMTEWEDYIIIE